MKKVLYEVPFNYKGVHECEMAVLCCIDFRFWRETMKFVDNYYRVKSYDFPKLPGSAKAINESANGDLARQCLDVPCDLHKVDKIVVVNHSDCGAYGGSEAFGGNQKKEQRFHEEQLRKAYRVLKDQHPEQEVDLIFARLNGIKTEIEFIAVDPKE